MQQIGLLSASYFSRSTHTKHDVIYITSTEQFDLLEHHPIFSTSEDIVLNCSLGCIVKKIKTTVHGNMCIEYNHYK